MRAHVRAALIASSVVGIFVALAGMLESLALGFGALVLWAYAVSRSWLFAVAYHHDVAWPQRWAILFARRARGRGAPPTCAGAPDE